jgi:ligand-binding SRPBCC domain-containing protein
MEPSVLHLEVSLPFPREQVFAFFSEPRNLEALTPNWLKFHILTPSPIEMRVGTVIEYRLRVHGVPLRWTSEITAWEPPVRFVDKQIHGPYRLWEHEHRFEERGGNTVVIDEVRYAVPGGKLMERWVVRRDLEKVFAFRERKLLEIFGLAQAA